MSLDVQGLSLSIKGRKVLDGVSFSVPAGGSLGIVGTMGSGKTSLLHCIKGIIPSIVKGEMQGSVLLGGAARKPMDMGIGIVFQNPNDQIFCPTLREEVEFGLRNQRWNGQLEERAAEALWKVGLHKRAEEDPFDLSHGQRQKLAIASVLAMDPGVILLDEPTSSLDHRTSLEIYSILSGLTREGKTVVVVEHDTDLLLGLGKQFLVLDSGRVVAQGDESIFLRGEVADCGVKIPWKRS